MSCEEIGDLLPWFVNGTLEVEERRRVEDHLAACPACRRALDETRFAGAAFAAHLPAEVLVDHAFGRPTAIAHETIEHHVADCERCAEELVLARAARAQEALVATREQTQEDADVHVFPAPPPRSTARPATGWRAAALAASLAALVPAGGLVWSWQETRQMRAVVATQEERVGELEGEVASARDRERELRAELERARESGDPTTGGIVAKLEQDVQRLVRENASLKAPRFDVNVFDVFPRLTRRGEAEAPPTVLPAASRAVTLLLQAPEDLVDSPTAYDRLGLDLVAPTGALLDRLPGLVYDPDEDYVVLHLPELPADRFEIVLHGHRDGQRVDLARYRVVRKSAE